MASNPEAKALGKGSTSAPRSAAIGIGATKITTGAKAESRGTAIKREATSDFFGL